MFKAVNHIMVAKAITLQYFLIKNSVSMPHSESKKGDVCSNNQLTSSNMDKTNVFRPKKFHNVLHH